MANLHLLEDDESRKLDTLVNTSGGTGLKRGVGSRAVAGLGDEAMAHAVATHVDEDDFNAADDIVVVAGVVPGSPDKTRRLLVDADGRLQAAAGPSRGTLTDISGTVTTGAIAQDLAAANAARKYLLIINPKAETEDLWIDFTADAVEDSPSIAIPPGGSFVFEAGFISTELVSVIAATTGHVFTAKEG